MNTITEIGLILIGDELLRGNRRDKHMEYMIGLLGERGLTLSWVEIIGDSEVQIAEALQRAQLRPALVFCFGGIGATPDDQTRQGAAAAAGLPIETHPEASALIEAQFGADAYPKRILMAHLPRGAVLIPNPVNQVPGFSLGNLHFVPGFPNMAWPMVEWVLEHRYPELRNEHPDIEQRLFIYETPESELIDLMQSLLHQYPGLGISSLPDTQHRKRIDFGLKGPALVVEKAYAHLISQLDAMEKTWTPLGD
jgi:molybdopterin-biosynthesis enzyme MoeA-like protein